MGFELEQEKKIFSFWKNKLYVLYANAKTLKLAFIW